MMKRNMLILIIGASLVLFIFWLSKKSRSIAGTEDDRQKAQIYLDKMNALFNKANKEQRELTPEEESLAYQWTKSVKDLGFTWIGGAYIALTPGEYELQSSQMF